MKKSREAQREVTAEELKSINRFLCLNHPSNVRDESALDRLADSFGTIDPEEGYLTGVAAQILCSILRDHPFTYRNRETAVLAMNTVMQMHECVVAATDEEFTEIAEKIERGTITRSQAREWIYAHFIPL